MTDHILTLICDDKPGLVHAVTGGLLDVHGNIVENAQFTDPDTNTFCMRTIVATPGDDSAAIHAAVDRRIGDIAGDGAQLRVRPRAQRPRVLIMVSKFDHCLDDLLYRHRTGELKMEVPAIVSNHPDLKPLADWHGIPFHHLPVTPDTKAEQEARLLDIIAETGTDLVVLARYMQVLSENLCEQLSGRAINIHHSFLPGFKGAKPYHQAHARGVKLIGATAHYVTSDLDEGPIIEQAVERVDHSYQPEHLVAVGRDTECLALARAVRFHIEHRVFLTGNKTVVFR